MNDDSSTSTISQIKSAGDLFSLPVVLNANKQRSITTNLGLILSLLLIIIMLVELILYLLKMFDFQEATILQLNELVINPSVIPLSLQASNFNFAISMAVNGNPVDMSAASLLTFAGSSNFYTRQPNGSLSESQLLVSFAPCTPADFPENIFGTNSFEYYNLEYAYCPSTMRFAYNNGSCMDFAEHYNNCLGPPQFNLSGSYLSQNYSSLQMSFSICNTQSTKTPPPTNMLCLDLSDIYDTFYNDSQVTVSFYFANGLIDPTSYETPNQTYMDVIYWDVTPMTSKSVDILVDGEVVQDYSSYYSSTDNMNQTFYSIDVTKVKEQLNMLFQNNTSETLLQVNLMRSNFNIVTKRTFLKIQDILSELGGFAKSIMFVFAYLVVGYARFKYQMVLSNQLYDFEPSEDYNYKKRRQTFQGGRKTINGREYRKESLGEGEIDKSMMNNSVVDNEEVKDYFDYQARKKRRLKYDEATYFKSLFECCRRSTPEEEMAAKARNQAEEDVDLVKILQKLKEIDKLKVLLLDRNQRELFDYIPKSVIELERDKPRNITFEIKNPDALWQKKGSRGKSFLFMEREDFDSLSKYGKLYLAYRSAKAKVDKMDDPTDRMYNRKLLGMLGPELIRVFGYVDNEVGNDASPLIFENVIKKMIQEGKHANVLDVSFKSSKSIKEPIQVFKRSDYEEPPLPRYRKNIFEKSIDDIHTIN